MAKKVYRFEGEKADVLWDGDDLSQAPEALLRSPGYLKANHGSGFNVRLGPRAASKQALVRMSRKWLRRSNQSCLRLRLDLVK